MVLHAAEREREQQLCTAACGHMSIQMAQWGLRHQAVPSHLATWRTHTQASCCPAALQIPARVSPATLHQTSASSRQGCAGTAPVITFLSLRAQIVGMVTPVMDLATVLRRRHCLQEVRTLWPQEGSRGPNGLQSIAESTCLGSNARQGRFYHDGSREGRLIQTRDAGSSWPCSTP